MEQLTRWVLGHRRLVVLAWVVLTVVGIATAGAASKAMDQRFTVPGREGWETSQEINRLYKGTGDSAPLLPVVALPAGTTAADPKVKAELADLEQRVAKAQPASRIAGYGSTGDDAFLSKDKRTAFVVAYPPPDPSQPFGGNPAAEKRVRAALRGVTVGGAPVNLT